MGFARPRGRWGVVGGLCGMSAREEKTTSATASTTPVDVPIATKATRQLTLKGEPAEAEGTLGGGGEVEWPGPSPFTFQTTLDKFINLK